MTRILMAGVVVAMLMGVRLASAHVGDDGTVHACVRSKSGSVRLVDQASGEACRHNEDALDWNREGPVGPTGPQGPQGDLGPTAVALGSSEFATVDLFPGERKQARVGCRDERNEIAVQHGYEILKSGLPADEAQDVEGVQVSTAFPFEVEAYVWRFNNVSSHRYQISLVVRCIPRA